MTHAIWQTYFCSSWIVVVFAFSYIESLQLHAQESFPQKQFEIRGTVYDAQGNALAGAELRTNPTLNKAPIATTDDRGNFSFLTTAGKRVAVLTTAKGCSPGLQHLSIDRNLDIEVRLQPSNGLRLRIVDRQGAAIQGVRISSDDWHDFAIIHHMTSDDDGHVLWTEAPNDPVEYLITKEGYSPKYNIKLNASTAEQQIMLTEIVEVTVLAKDQQSGESIDEFTAVPVLKQRSDSFKTCYRSSAVHGKGGVANIKLHESDSQSCQIRIEAGGYEVTSSLDFDVGKAPASLVVKLKRAEAKRGKIVDAGGAPLVGVRVSFANALQTFSLRSLEKNYTVESDEQGEFEFPCEEGNYSLVAQNDKGFSLRHFTSGESLGTIQLQPWATIKGKIGLGSQPIEKHLVTLSDFFVDAPNRSRIDFTGFIRSDTQGNFEFARVPPGRYALQANDSIFRSDGLESTESLPFDVSAAQEFGCLLGVEGSEFRGKVRVVNQGDRRFDYGWSLNYLVSADGPFEPTLDEKMSLDFLASLSTNFNSAATWSTSEGTARLRSFRHWQFRLNEGGNFVVHGVPPGQYRLFVNLFDPPQDGCLAAPVATHAMDVELPRRNESVMLPTIELQATSPLIEGSEVPDVEYKKLDGSKALLSELRGKVVLIQLWATWCGPCIAEFPEVSEFVESEAGKRCVVLGLSVDAREKDIASFLSDRNVSWPQGKLLAGLDAPEIRALSVSSIPTHIVIDVDGRLVFTGRSFKDAAESVKRILKLSKD